MFAALGITPGAGLSAGGHTGAVRAVYNGEADFATVFFSPNIDLDGNTVWDGTEEDADVPADAIESCGLTDGDLVCGTIRPRDARRGLREEAPDVIQKVRILFLSDPIPNDLMAFGPEFPADLRADIVQAMKDYAANDPDGFAAAFEAYSWDDVADTTDAEFDSIRALLTALGYDLEDL
jgi:phosphonate transport system substrate-binding protein